MSGQATEAQADAAIAVLRRAIDAAENSNQAGENAVVMMAAAPALFEALSNFIAGADAGHVSVEVDNAARAALAKARGDA